MFNILRKQPATIALVLAAFAATNWSWFWNMDPFTLDARAFWREPWRLLTSVLPHADFVHLLLNIYWLGLFGGKFEEEFGSFKTALVYVVLGIGSSTAEYALLDSGIGLSGIVYGLFALLWMVHYLDSRFADVITPKIVMLFVVFFLLCIAATVTNFWNIGNLSHAVGALLGGLIGWSLATTPSRRWFGWSVVSTSMIVFLLAAMARPYVNLTDRVADEYAYLGYLALEKGRSRESVERLKNATNMEPDNALWWQNLGIAYYRLGDIENALAAYEHADRIAPSDSEMKMHMFELKLSLAYEKQVAGKLAESIGIYEDVLSIDANNKIALFNLAVAYHQSGEINKALKTIDQALVIDPDNTSYREMRDALEQELRATNANR